MKYLTPAQYYRADEGLTSVPNMSMNTIRRFVARAEAMIDAYVGFDARLGGFEPHTTWYQTAWKGNDGDLSIRIPTHPVPVITPIRYRIQISMVGSNTNPTGFYATIQPGDIAIQNFSSYIEIVPLQAVLYSMLPVMIELGMDPPQVVLDVEMGYYFDELNDILEDDGDHQTYWALRGFWAQTYDLNPTLIPNTPHVVGMQNQNSAIYGAAYTTNPLGLPYRLYKNGTALTTNITTQSPIAAPPAAGQILVDPVEGKAVFGTPNSGSDVIKGAYTYQIPDPVREAAIAQTTFLLANRDLTRQGMRALDAVVNAQQTLTRHKRMGTRSGVSPIDEPTMDPIAMQVLAPYRQWAVG